MNHERFSFEVNEQDSAQEGFDFCNSDANMDSNPFGETAFTPLENPFENSGGHFSSGPNVDLIENFEEAAPQDLGLADYDLNPEDLAGQFAALDLNFEEKVKIVPEWDNYSLFQSEEDTTSPGWESTESKDPESLLELEPELESNAENSLTESGKTEDSGDSQGKSLRGRPRKDKFLSKEEIFSKFQAHLLKKFRSFEKSAREDSGSTTSRNRDDKPRTKIIRLCKTLPTFLLKLLVSVGDYKHSEAARLNESYVKAFNGFLDIITYLNLNASLSAHLESMPYSHVLCFAGIAFPKSKVTSVATLRDEGDKISVNSFMDGRDATSIRLIKRQMEKNSMFKILFKVAFQSLREYAGEFPICMNILEELANL